MATHSLVVADGSMFPSAGDFRLLIDSELVLCTAVAGDTLTIVRAQEGTTAAAHDSGTRVYQLLTQGDLDRYGQDNNPLFDGGPGPAHHRRQMKTSHVPADLHFAGLGQRRCGQVPDNGSSIVLVTNTLTNAVLTWPVPTTATWQLTAAMRGVSMGPSAYNGWCGRGRPSA